MPRPPIPTWFDEVRQIFQRVARGAAIYPLDLIAREGFPFA